MARKGHRLGKQYTQILHQRYVAGFLQNIRNSALSDKCSLMWVRDPEDFRTCSYPILFHIWSRVYWIAKDGR